MQPLENTWIFSLILVVVLTCSASPPSADDSQGCPVGHYRFIFEGDSPFAGTESNAVVVHERTVAVQGICAATPIRTKDRTDLRAFSATLTSCSGIRDPVEIEAQFRLPYCNVLEGTITRADRTPRKFTARLPSCDTIKLDDQTLDAETGDDVAQLKDPWGDPHDFLRVFLLGQARHGCSLFDDEGNRRATSAPKRRATRQLSPTPTVAE